MFLNLHAVTNNRVVSQWGLAADWMAEGRFPVGEGVFIFVIAYRLALEPSRLYLEVIRPNSTW